MTFDEILAQVTDSAAQIPEGWGQGRACFGGLVAAVLYAPLGRLINDRPVRSITVSFVGPVAPGPVTLETEILRTGKSVTQAQSRLRQNGETLAVMLASFGKARSSEISVPSAVAPKAKRPEEGMPMPRVKGLVPDFTFHFDFRWVEGDAPFSRSDRGLIGGWVRFAEPTQHNGVASLLALVDAWPPAVLPMYSRPAPGSSLTWTIEFLQDGPFTGEWWQYRADTEYASEGYCHAAANLWNDRGEMVAISRQTVTVFI